MEDSVEQAPNLNDADVDVRSCEKPGIPDDSLSQSQLPAMESINLLPYVPRSLEVDGETTPGERSARLPFARISCLD